MIYEPNMLCFLSFAKTFSLSQQIAQITVNSLVLCAARLRGIYKRTTDVAS